MDRRMAQDLDNYITGHWGEDFFRPWMCPFCDKPVDENLDDWTDTPEGIAHDICYAEHLDGIETEYFNTAVTMLENETFKLNLPQDDADEAAFYDANIAEWRKEQEEQETP